MIKSIDTLGNCVILTLMICCFDINENKNLQAVTGVPALLIYKKGEMIGNFVRLSDELGSDFFANDVEGFLHE